CGAGSYCDDSGQCQADSSDNETPITVPDGTGGTRDITPLDPPVANQVGATPGTFAVNENGDATYTVPIEVPPGRAGMMPELAIAYSSSGGNGLLGKGWSIQGLSAISRCPRTFARDGAPKAVQNDATDAYCLDGQRLIPLGGNDTDPVREYRTDVDSFSKIVSYGGNQLGPISFKVWTRDGRILSYGSTANSRLYTALQNSVRLWALDRVEDRAGNSTDVHYDKVERTVGGTMEMVPVRLAYGGNATLEHDRSVRLVYEKRPPEDVREGFSQGGGPYSLSKRLLRLETTVRH